MNYQFVSKKVNNLLYFYRLPTDSDANIVVRDGKNILKASRVRTEDELLGALNEAIQNFEENRYTTDISSPKGYHTGKLLAYNDEDVVYSTFTKQPELKIKGKTSTTLDTTTHYENVELAPRIKPQHQYETPTIYSKFDDSGLRAPSLSDPLQSRTHILKANSSAYDYIRGWKFALFKKTEFIVTEPNSSKLRVEASPTPKTDLEKILARSEGKIKDDGKVLFELSKEIQKLGTKHDVQFELIRDAMDAAMTNESYLGSRINTETGAVKHIYSPATSPVTGSKTVSLKVLEKLMGD